MREGFGSLALTVILTLSSLGCAARQRPKELVALEKLESDPTLTDTDRAAFNRLAAADALLLRAEIDWDHHDVYATRQDALMGQIKMKTAIAMIQSEHASARIAQLDTDLALANDEYGDLSDRLAVVNEEVALMGRLRAATSAAADERKALSDQVEAVKKQAGSERQRLVEQVATERQRAAALDGLRGAELAIRTAETLDAATFAKAKYAAASNMLQQAQKEFDAGHWDGVLAGTTLARTEAAQAAEVSRPRYEQAAAAMNNRGRDRELEGDATAIGGLRTRLERDGDLQRLVLVISGLFAAKQSVLLPDGAKTLDAVRDLLIKYPTYPVQLAAFADEPTTSDNRTALSLARANAVYWALVRGGVEPKRLGIDAGGTDPSSDTLPAAGRAKSALIELSLLYHITP
jgi:outer membrane protein OmpA-like peptidoglycan-associated protein